MELFDKKFVYFEWDNILEGKEVFLANALAVLKRAVMLDEDRLSVEENDGDYPFTSPAGVHYSMAYYDPNYSCKRAYMEGKVIQCKSSRIPDDKWEDCVCGPEWADHCEYRVKPEEPEKKWRPFKSIEELKHVWDVKLSPLEEPTIWVRSKSNTTSTYQITHFCGNMGVVYLCGYLNIGLEQLFDDYTFLDGSPCGMLAVEEE